MGRFYNLTGVQIGTYAGAGLSGGGDAVTLWIGEPNTVGNIVDFQTYPDAAPTPGQSYDVEKAAFSVIGEAPYFPVATAVNNEGESAIGSPGNLGPALSVEDSQLSGLNTKVFPLPFQNEITILFNLKSSVTVSIKIISILGKTFYKEHLSILNGKIKIEKLDNLSSGIYILRIPELNLNTKIIKN